MKFSYPSHLKQASQHNFIKQIAFISCLQTQINIKYIFLFSSFLTLNPVIFNRSAANFFSYLLIYFGDFYISAYKKLLWSFFNCLAFKKEYSALKYKINMRKWENYRNLGKK